MEARAGGAPDAREVVFLKDSMKKSMDSGAGELRMPALGNPLWETRSGFHKLVWIRSVFGKL